MMRDDIATLGFATAEQQQELKDLWHKIGEEDADAHFHPTPYEDRIVRQFSGWAPTIPNMRVELASGETAADEEADYVSGLINWCKFFPHASRCVVLNRFQAQRYNFLVIPQIRKVILRGAEMSREDIEDKLDDQIRLFPRD
jgi:hypothetical protein